MLRCFNYDIVCQEIPDELTLALNISGCPNHCPGCHSPWLWEDTGELLDESLLRQLLDRYAGAVSCVCLMGGDQDLQAVEALLSWLRLHYPELKLGWYSGRSELPMGFDLALLDYLKLGPYVEALGGLRSPHTNQKLYRVEEGGHLCPLPLY